jgi:hypothetical protein
MLSNPALWDLRKRFPGLQLEFQKTKKRKDPYEAFRHCANRIRKFFGYPKSEDL